jgi:putative Mg2+ transporter-C (MgtC) family protein
MDIVVDDLFQLPDMTQLARVLVRVVVAAALGGLLGAERERAGKAAGLRTHMLVALGAALFVLFPAEAGMSTGDLSRVIQGVATGIGFIGAGTILKRTDSDEIHGLTTAASIWLTAAIGMAVGAGRLWLPVICAVAAWIILFVLSRVTPPKPAPQTPSSSGG